KHDYFELLGVVAEAEQEGSFGRAFFDRREGLFGAALGVGDIRGAVRGLEQHGLGNSLKVVTLGRSLSVADNDISMSAAVALLPVETMPGIRLIMCEHSTPAALRRPEWLDHPNDALGLARLTMVVERPESLGSRCEALFGAGSTVVTDNTLTVFTGAHSVMMVTPAHLPVMFPDVAIEDRRSTYLAAMSIMVGDLERTARTLENNQAPFHVTADDTIHVAARDAGGVIVEFCLQAHCLEASSALH
ncbi:MAG: VOC family protein, partial [Sphingomonadales bacterium]